MSSRRDYVKVSLNDQELARLDELRGDEERAVHLRRLLYRPPDGSEVCTHTESLALLSGLARDRKVSAAIALERALRAEGGQEPRGELWRLLHGGDD